MPRLQRIALFMVSAALLAGAFLFFRNTSGPLPQPAPTDAAITADPAPRPVNAPAGAAVVAAQPVTAPALPALAADATPAERFKAWTARYLAAPESERPKMLAEGQVLARQRLDQLKQLIRKDPESALDQALPYSIRRQLPDSFKPLLEEPVSGSGSFSVKVYCPLPGKEGLEPPPERQFKVEGRRYNAFVYGWRNQMMSKAEISAHGIAVGDDLALSSDPVRTVPAAEVADLVGAGRAELGALCKVCGQPATPPVLLDMGTGRFETVCAAHARTINQAIRYGLANGCSESCAMQQLLASTADGARPLNQKLLQLQQFWQPKQAYGGVSGSTNPPTPAPGRMGQRRLLLVPTRFGDESGPPVTQQTAEIAGQGVAAQYDRMSFGRQQIIHTVAPLVTLPDRKSVYDEQGDGAIINDAVNIVATQGYDVGQYDYIYVITTSFPSANFGGISSGLVFGAGVGVLVHEIGHNNGLGHANFFDNSVPPNPTQPNPALPFDPDSQIGHFDINGPFLNSLSSPVGGGTGSILEYGDQFDTMGSGGSDFSASMKSSMGWLPPQFVRTVPASETNRIYAFDQGAVTNGRTYALRIQRRVHETPNGGVYWLSHRRAITSNPWLMNGVLLQHGTSVTLLLDSTAQSSDGRNDSAVVVGRTFTDPEAGVHITPTAVGGTGASSWIDVVVRRGPFPGNQPPVINSLQASSLAVAVGAPVTFTVDAVDADGDPLAYYFDFGGGEFGTNAPVNTRSFTSAGSYVVRVEVSDMKGGVASKSIVVTVGTPTTYTVSGRVLDGDGVPVAGVRVHNGVNGAGNRYGFSDTDGTYYIADVAPGTYTPGAFKYRHRIAPVNFNGTIAVGAADVSGVDFVSEAITLLNASVVSNAVESGTPGVFRISRTGSVSNDLNVKVLLSTPDSAGFNSSATTNVTIPAGQSFADVTVTPIDNSVGDGGRRVVLSLRLQTNYQTITSFFTNGAFALRTNNIASPGWEALPRLTDGALTWFQTYPNYVCGNAEATMLIVDDDPVGTPNVSITAANSGVVEGSRSVGNFVVARSGSPLTSDLTVNLAFSGSATNGIDYLTLPGSVTIPAGEQFAIVPIIPINNYFVESNRTARCTIAAGAGYTGAGSTATLTIVDDDLPNVGVFAADPRAGRGGGNTGRFTIARSGDTTRDLLVNYLVTGTAVAGSDYQVLSGSVVIPAGQLSVDVTVTPTATASSPGPKTVVLVLSDSPTYNIRNLGRSTVTIADNVPTVTIAAAGGATEGGGSGGFTVSRTGSTANPLTVFFTVGGSANPNTDYVGVGTNIVIPAGQGSATITITPVNDTYREFTAAGQNNARLNEHENVQITLLPNDATYDLGNNITASITITDDDSNDFPGVGFLTSSTTVREDAGTISIPVRIYGNPTNNPNLPVLINWSVTGGTAVNGTNYVLAPDSGTFSFISNRIATAGAYRFTAQNDAIDVTILDDGVIAPTRTLVFTLSYFMGLLTNISGGTTNILPYPTNAVLGDYRTHTVFIQDTDAAVVSVQTVTGLAYEEGTVPGAFRITRTGSTAAPLTVNVVTEGTAVPGADYVAIPSQITIPAGTNQVLVLVTPIDDPAQEQAETVDLRLAQTPGVQFGQDSAQVIIVDNDGTIQFTSATYSAREDATNAVIDVIRTGNTNVTAKVDYVFTDGSAQNLSDYLGANGTLTFAPGELSKSILVPLVNDTTVESDETFSLYLTNATGGVPLGGQRVATVTIVNDDTAFEFSGPVLRVNENATNAFISVNRIGVTTGTNSVNFATSPGTAGAADYTDVTTNLVFLPGETTKVVVVPVLDDAAIEGDETVTLTLSNPSTGTGLGTNTPATLLIVDDESIVAFASATYQTNEYAGSVQLEVRRSGGTVNTVQVNLATANGTATNGFDYTGVNTTVTFLGERYVVDTNGTGQLIFIPGETNKTVTVTILDDVLGEGPETFNASLSAPLTVSPALAGSTTLGSPTNTVVTILDNETPGNVDYEFVTGTGANDSVLSISLQSDGRAVIGGRFTTVNGLVLRRVARLTSSGAVDASFNPGAGANSNVLAVASQSDDKVLVGGAFTTMDGTNRTRLARLNADGNLDVTYDPGTGANNTVRAIAVQADGKALVGGDFTVFNSISNQYLVRLDTNGAVDTSFNAVVSGPVEAIALQSDGAIVIGGAFTNVNGLPLSGIARLNPDGSSDLTFNNATGVNSTVYAVGVQSDNRIVLGGAFTIVNGVTNAFLARLNSDGSLDTTFNSGSGPDAPVNALALDPTDERIVIGGNFTTFNGTSRNGFTRLNTDGSLDSLFDPGSGANAPVRAVAVQSDTAIIIGGDFTVVNSIPRNRVARIHGDEYSVLVGVQFTRSGITVSEGVGSALVTLRRSGNLSIPFTVNVGTVDGTAVAGGLNPDYVATNGTVTFNPGDRTRTFAVNIVDDSLVETTEQFRVVITGSSPGVILSGLTNTTVSILDNEKTVRFVSPAYSALENATNAIISVERTGDATGAVTVQYTAFAGTAAAGADFVATNGLLSWADGELGVKTFPVALLNDTAPEGDETINLSLFNATGGALLGIPSDAVLTVVDDDVELKFSAPAYSALESDTNAVITVVRFGATNAPVSVSYFSAAFSATAGADYTDVAGALSWAAGDSAPKTFTVPIAQDSILESAETVSLFLTNVVGASASIGTPAAAVLTIIDPNASTTFVPAGAVLVSESGPVNGVIDPGETVTLNLGIRNVGLTNSVNLAATLLNTNGVSGAPSAVSYGATIAGGPAVWRPFTFTANGTNGGLLSAIVRLNDGATDHGAIPFNFFLGSQLVRFANAAPIVINDNTTASPYPATLNVSGLSGVISKVTVTLSNLTHSFPGDIDILLVSPTGQKMVLMSDAGSFGGSPNGITNVTLTFDDQATNSLTTNKIVAGTYRPSNLAIVTSDFWPSPAPAGPYATNLATFAGIDPNGTWSLYVFDDNATDAGVIAGGWSLAITQAGVVNPAGDLAVSGVASPNPVLAGQPVTFSITVSNAGSTVANDVVLTNVLPAALNPTGAVNTHGSYYQSGNSIIFQLGTIAIGASKSVSITGVGTNPGTVVDVARVTSTLIDSVAANNTANVTNTVLSAANLAVTMTLQPVPSVVGNAITYRLLVTNQGPNTATGVALTNLLPASASYVSATTTAGTVSNSAGTVSAAIGTLPSGASATVTIVALPSAIGTITNLAFVKAAQGDPALSDNQQSLASAVIARPSLTQLVSGSFLVFSWPAEASNFALYYTDSLNAPINWQAAGGSPVLIGSTYVLAVAIDPLAPERFYSLRQTVSP